MSVFKEKKIIAESHSKVKDGKSLRFWAVQQPTLGKVVSKVDSREGGWDFLYNSIEGTMWLANDDKLYKYLRNYAAKEILDMEAFNESTLEKPYILIADYEDMDGNISYGLVLGEYEDMESARRDKVEFASLDSSYFNLEIIGNEMDYEYGEEFEEEPSQYSIEVEIADHGYGSDEEFINAMSSSFNIQASRLEGNMWKLSSSNETDLKTYIAYNYYPMRANDSEELWDMFSRISIEGAIGDVEEISESTHYMLYLFPEEVGYDEWEEREMLAVYNLTLLGKNYEDGYTNYVVKGTLKNLERYADEYLDYQLHPDFLYKEDDFAGEIVGMEDDTDMYEDSLQESFDGDDIYEKEFIKAFNKIEVTDGEYIMRLETWPGSPYFGYHMEDADMSASEHGKIADIFPNYMYSGPNSDFGHYKVVGTDLELWEYLGAIGDYLFLTYIQPEDLEDEENYDKENYELGKKLLGIRDKSNDNFDWDSEYFEESIEKETEVPTTLYDWKKLIEKELVEIEEKYEKRIRVYDGVMYNEEETERREYLLISAYNNSRKEISNMLERLKSFAEGANLILTFEEKDASDNYRKDSIEYKVFITYLDGTELSSNEGYDYNYEIGGDEEDSDDYNYYEVIEREDGNESYVQVEGRYNEYSDIIVTVAAYNKSDDSVIESKEYKVSRHDEISSDAWEYYDLLKDKYIDKYDKKNDNPYYGIDPDVYPYEESVDDDYGISEVGFWEDRTEPDADYDRVLDILIKVEDYLEHAKNNGRISKGQTFEAMLPKYIKAGIEFGIDEEILKHVEEYFDINKR